MNHIDRIIQALDLAGFGVHVYVDNNHVFGFDITCALEGYNREQHTENIGHAVFAASKRKNRPELVFVEGRLFRTTFAAVGQTPARALFNFEQFLNSQVMA